MTGCIRPNRAEPDRARPDGRNHIGGIGRIGTGQFFLANSSCQLPLFIPESWISTVGDGTFIQESWISTVGIGTFIQESWISTDTGSGKTMRIVKTANMIATTAKIHGQRARGRRSTGRISGSRSTRSFVSGGGIRRVLICLTPFRTFRTSLALSALWHDPLPVRARRQGE